MAPTIPEQVVDLIGYANAGLDKAAAITEAHAAQQAKIAAMVPQVCDAMIKGGRATEADRDKIAAALQDPVKTVELLAKVAVHRSSHEIGALGAPTQTVKQANERSRFVATGAKSAAPRESDMKLFAGLGLAAPTGN